jgi:hypothetical protein
MFVVPNHPLMKIFSYLFLFVFILACNLGKIDELKARTMVESLINDLKNENYSSLDKYYASSFNESEPMKDKIAKFKRLKEATGPIKSYELISSELNQNSDRGVNELQLKYKVVCDKLTVQHNYLIINDEGHLKIIFQNIENIKK